MTMKKLFCFSVSLLLFVNGWVTGYMSALVVNWHNTPLPNPVINSDVPCTCAPCLPDTWCRKCGHVSRDCPKLAWYFKRVTNTVERVVK